MNGRTQKSKNGKVETGEARMFDIADLKCEEILVSTCSIPKNVVVFTHLIAVKFEATLGCIDYLFGKFCVTLFVVCIFFYW